MDVTKYVDGEWLDIAVVSDREMDSFRFKVQPIGELAVMANLQRKAEAASRMFAMIVEEMGSELKVKREDRFSNSVEIPSWL